MLLEGGDQLCLVWRVVEKVNSLGGMLFADEFVEVGQRRVYRSLLM